MKWIIDEKLKHRLLGLAVVIALGVVFLPVIMQDSKEYLEDNLNLGVQLPPKPLVSKGVVSHEEELFKTIEIPQIAGERLIKKKKVTDLEKEELIQSSVQPKEEAVPAVTKTDPALINAAQNVIKKPAARNSQSLPLQAKIVSATETKIIKKPPPIQVSKKEIYVLQVASFSNLSRAQALVNQLRSKGYKANFIKGVAKGRSVYKVHVGSSTTRGDLIKVQIQLAKLMDLNGFIVPIEVRH